MATPKKRPYLELKKNAQKQFNMKVGRLDEVAEDVQFITTGNMAIDSVFGGGIPLGRTTELAGPPSSGKTTTGLQTCARLQQLIKSGGDPIRGIGAEDYMLYLDYEQALDPDYVEKLGLDFEHDSFQLSQPDTLEDGANFAAAAAATGEFRLIVVDSVAAMLPSAKAEAEIGKSLPAVQAKLLADFGAKMNPILFQNNCALIYINHVREVMEMGGGRRPGMPARTSTPGGVALKFYESIRAEYKQLQKIKEEQIDPLTKEKTDMVVATNVAVKVTKNKVARPFREATVRVRFGTGFDNFWNAMQILIAYKKVMVQGAYAYFHNLDADGLAPEWMERAKTGTQRPYILGQKALYAAADEYPEWRAGIIAAAEAIISLDKKALEALGKQGTVEQDDDEEDSELSSDEIKNLLDE